MIHYILQIIGFQLLFLLVYEVFLKKETFFTWNRVYLLLTPLVSLVLPLLKIPVLQQSIPESYKIALPEVLTGVPLQETVLNGGQLAEVTITGTGSVNLYTILTNIWYVGVFMGVLFFAYKLYKIWNLSSLGTSRKIDGIRVITLPNSTTAFSFFNTMYLGADLSEIQRKSIVMHEAVHIKERHSIDLLFFELLRIVFWFNPLVYIYQKELTLLQEFQADATAVLQTDKAKYYQELLARVFQTEKISFINTFFNHSFIKKRITMLQKSKSNRVAKFKYALIVPLLCAMLFYVSCSEDARQEETIDSSPEFVGLKIQEKSVIDKNFFLLRSTIVEGKPDFFVLQINDQNKLSSSEEAFFKKLIGNFSIGLKAFPSNEPNGKQIYTFKGFDQIDNLIEKYDISSFGIDDLKKFSIEADGTTKEIEIEQLLDSKLIYQTSGKANTVDVQSPLLQMDHLSFEEKVSRLYLPYKERETVNRLEFNTFDNTLTELFNSDDEDQSHTAKIVVKYSNLMSDKYSRYLETAAERKDIPYTVIDKVPAFLGCQDIVSNDDRKKCTSEKIGKHVNKNFNIDIAKSLNLKGTNRIFVSFKIDVMGNVTNVRSRATHPELEKEANRAVGTLPKMLPGEQNGRPVGVLYSLPITFNIAE